MGRTSGSHCRFNSEIATVFSAMLPQSIIWTASIAYKIVFFWVADTLNHKGTRTLQDLVLRPWFPRQPASIFVINEWSVSNWVITVLTSFNTQPWRVGSTSKSLPAKLSPESVEGPGAQPNHFCLLIQLMTDNARITIPPEQRDQFNFKALLFLFSSVGI